MKTEGKSSHTFFSLEFEYFFAVAPFAGSVAACNM
jgi:hypothetical protein